MLILTPILTRKSKSSSVFGFSIYSISIVYFLLQLFIGIIFILVSPAGVQATLLIQICVAGRYGIILITNLIGNERTADAEEKQQYEIAYEKIRPLYLKVC